MMELLPTANPPRDHAIRIYCIECSIDHMACTPVRYLSLHRLLLFVGERVQSQLTVATESQVDPSMESVVTQLQQRYNAAFGKEKGSPVSSYLASCNTT